MLKDAAAHILAALVAADAEHQVIRALTADHIATRTHSCSAGGIIVLARLLRELNTADSAAQARVQLSSNFPHGNLTPLASTDAEVGKCETSPRLWLRWGLRARAAR